MTIRPATADDTAALVRLAQRDSAAMLRAPLIVGEVDGEVRAAVGLDGVPALADPFRHTSEIVDLLEARAAQLRRSSGRSRIALRTPERQCAAGLQGRPA